MAFEIQLAEQKVKSHQVTALHLIAGFALLAFSAIGLLVNNTVMTLPGSAPIEQQEITIQQFDNIDTGLSIVMAISAVILFAGMFRNKWLRKPANNRIFRIIELIVLAAISIFMLTKQYNVPAALFGLLAATIVFSLFWESGKKTNTSVLFTDSGIKLPVTSRRRQINWTEVEKVLLRHGNVTINCVDNRLYQWVVAGQHADVTAFEAYCHAQIEAARKSRMAEW